MRIAVLSDIHGNLTALEAVVKDLIDASPDLVVHGGDLVGGSRNAEVIDLVRASGWSGVFGNAEEMLWMPEQIARNVPGPEFARMRNVLLNETIPFIRAAIGAERLEWLRSLPRRCTQSDVAIVHAGPESVWVSPWADASDAELSTVYGPLKCPTVVYGHIHQPFVRRMSGFTVANSGSLSFSYDGDRRAAYVLIDGDRVSIRRVEYDVEDEIASLVAADYPDAEWLSEIYRAARPIAPR